MPELLTELAKRTEEPPPIRGSAQAALRRWQSTHMDSLRELKDKFTSEQWDIVTEGVFLAPSYIS